MHAPFLWLALSPYSLLTDTRTWTTGTMQGGDGLGLADIDIMMG